MTNRGNRLLLFEEALGKLHGLRDGPKFIRIGYAAGEQQRIVIVGIGGIERHIHWEFVAFVLMLPSLYLALGRRDQISLRSGVVQRLARFRHLHLFKTVRY